MGTWIPSHQSLATHRKVLALASALSVSRPTAIGHLHLFWWWCYDNAPTGSLKGVNAEQLRAITLFEGDANLLLSALIQAHFIDRRGRGLFVHNWDEYAGKHLREREAERERSRDRRTTAGRPPDNGRTTDKQPSAEKTRQEKTREEEIREDRSLTPPTPPDRGRRFEGDEVFGSFATLYENEIGTLSETVAGELDGLIADGVPLRWFQEAVKIAACAGKRNLRYVKGILKNYQSEGFQVEEEEHEPNDAVGAAVARFRAEHPEAFDG